MSESYDKYDPKTEEETVINKNNNIIPINKSETFDAELELLESTLSQIKDCEIKNDSASHSCVNLTIKDHSEINVLGLPKNNCNDITDTTNNCKFLTGVIHNGNDVSKKTFHSEVTTSLLKPSLPTAQHSKPMYHREVSVDCLNSSENVFSQVDCNSCELRSEIMNNTCSVEVNKLVLITDCNQTTITCNEKQCDEQPCIPMNSFEQMESNKDPEPLLNVGLSSSAEEPSQTPECSSENYDFIHNTNNSPSYLANNNLEKPNVESLTNKDLHETSVRKLNGCDILTEPTSKMEDAEISWKKFPWKTEVFNNDSNAAEVPQTVGHGFEIPMPGTQIADEENKDQENATKDNEEEHFKILESHTTPKKPNFETEKNEALDFKPEKNQGIFYSTPNVSRNLEGDKDSCFEDPYFGYVSPLKVKSSQGKQNLKRKNFGLQPIEEIDENTDSPSEKKIKIEESNLVECSSDLHYEAPAKHLLKMWLPSCLSRSVLSSSGFVVLDECGDDTNVDSCPKVSQENSSKLDSSKLDDFEIAYQSLTDELVKGSSHIETLEKYHSQVQLENQMDDEKFDEIWRELTMNVDLDDKTCLSLKSMDESTMSEMSKTCLVLQDMDQSVDITKSSAKKKTEVDNESFSSENNVTVVEGNNTLPAHENDCLNIDIKSEIIDTNGVKEKSEIKIKEEEKRDDEEDVLLEEGNNNEKEYEYFEFVSNDPQENEDNYNPEWQRLGSLTTDEERYKAVRDRWRSLIPPDPNRNLTFRQWRAKNSMPPIEFTQNDNHHMMDDNAKKQLCTAVFEEKINSMVKELEISRMDIFRNRNREFELLGHEQDKEQMRARMIGLRHQDLARLHSHHLKQCWSIKNQYDLELKRIKEITEAKIQILREASEEVLLFQKFYKGVGAQDDTEMYMTDIQVQELMETEEMLEKYTKMYN